MRFRGITFDLDGTLADTLPICYVAFRRVFLAHTGREYSDAEIHAMFGPCEKGLLQRVMPDWEPAFEMFLREYRVAHELCPEPFPGVVDLLDWLDADGVRMAVVTGKGPESAAISLTRLGLRDRFEVVESGSPDGAIKSDAIRRILDLWRIPPSELAHVGDAPNDIQAARAAGATAIAAAWASTSRRESLEAEGPDAIFGSIASLHEWLIGSIRGSMSS
ncbi:MAG: HAD family hydrolase [Fimbriimonadales bacterium]